MAKADVDEILAAQPDKLPDVDWDDPKAVASARGDAQPSTEGGEGARSTAEQVAKDQAEAKADQAKADQAKADQAKAGQAKAKEKDKDIQIPKSRFDEVNTRAKQAQTENEELKAKLAKFEARDELIQEARNRQDQDNEEIQALKEHEARIKKVDDLEGKFTELLSENKLDEAKQVRGQITRLNREIAQDEINLATYEATTETREQLKFDKAVDRLEEKHPEFDPENTEKYDQELVNTTLALAKGLEATEGLSSSAALMKAVKKIMPSTQGKEGLTQTKRQEAIERGLKAAKQQGTDHDGVGADADEAGMTEELDMTQLTEKDLLNLPESKLKKLRGDFATNVD